jgi:hypothetical protein
MIAILSKLVKILIGLAGKFIILGANIFYLKAKYNNIWYLKKDFDIFDWFPYNKHGNLLILMYDYFHILYQLFSILVSKEKIFKLFDMLVNIW